MRVGTREARTAANPAGKEKRLSKVDSRVREGDDEQQIPRCARDDKAYHSPRTRLAKAWQRAARRTGG